MTINSRILNILTHDKYDHNDFDDVDAVWYVKELHSLNHPVWGEITSLYLMSDGSYEVQYNGHDDHCQLPIDEINECKTYKLTEIT